MIPVCFVCMREIKEGVKFSCDQCLLHLCCVSCAEFLRDICKHQVCCRCRKKIQTESNELYGFTYSLKRKISIHHILYIFTFVLMSISQVILHLDFFRNHYPGGETGSWSGCQSKMSDPWAHFLNRDYSTLDKILSFARIGHQCHRINVDYGLFRDIGDIIYTSTKEITAGKERLTIYTVYVPTLVPLHFGLHSLTFSFLLIILISNIIDNYTTGDMRRLLTRRKKFLLCRSIQSN